MDPWYRTAREVVSAHGKVVYRVDGEGETVLCLHGFPTSSIDFEPLWPQITARFQGVAFDLLGLGHSDKPASELTVGMQADAAEAVLKALGVDEAHLFAHDLGDTVAQELLARQAEGRSPVKWLSCVFLNGGILAEYHRPRFIQTLLASRLGPVIAQLASYRTFRRNMQQIGSKTHPVSEAFLQRSWEALRHGGGRRSMPYLIRYMEERRKQRSRWAPAVLSPSIPTRFINGTLDPISGGHVMDAIEGRSQRADVVRLDHLGHYPHVEDPQAVWGALEGFWSERAAFKGS